MRYLHPFNILLLVVLMGCSGEDLRYTGPNPIDPKDNLEPPSPDVPFLAVSDEYSYLGVTESAALYQESNRFRIYYGTEEKDEINPGLSHETTDDLTLALELLESAYTFFVDEWGFRSPGLSIYSNTGPYYKLNVYATTGFPAGGEMFSSANAGLSYFITRQGSQTKVRMISEPSIIVHEFAHTLTYSEYNWSSQSNAMAWWEAVAEWAADTYQQSPAYADIATKWGLSLPGQSEKPVTRFSPSVTISSSYLSIVHKANEYKAWPFLTYLTNNPDNIANLGKMIVPNLHWQHAHNNETPLHVLERIIAPVTVQYVLGRYWARMAYLDIDHQGIKDAYNYHFADNEVSRKIAYSNLSLMDNGDYEVIVDRAPMYGGANICPLRKLDNTIDVHVKSREDDGAQGFTATMSILDVDSGSVRYVALVDGQASVVLSDQEEATLVVVNTPDNLINYDAYKSTDESPERKPLYYTVSLIGAEPEYDLDF